MVEILECSEIKEQGWSLIKWYIVADQKNHLNSYLLELFLHNLDYNKLFKWELQRHFWLYIVYHNR